MQVLETKKPFEIQEIKLNEWKQRPAKNNFFELVLIKEGEGTQCINYNHYEYQKGSIFLLPPLNCHSFNIGSPTSFVFLKFTADFFKNTSQTFETDEWFREASYILSNYNQLPGDIIKSDLDKSYIERLIIMILEEAKNYEPNSITLIKSLMSSILEILIRNIKKGALYEVPQQATDSKINQMLLYINDHINNNDSLKIESIAETFLMSPTYVSEYFKKQVKISLREYIIKAKLKLVEIRLINSDYTLSEIADELNFTDVSHLSKTFKKYTGVSLSEFRKKGEYMLLKRGSCAL
ncbi:MAG: AraC family transcriptional regulator [Flavobacteriales bacterium]|jgi:AraC-like DNA-binding protein|nr:AraC family transcriptional regulator [Flavobacteriales bacterium]